MAGGIISLALVLVYMAHTCVAWKGVRTTKATPKNDHRELLHEWEVQNEIPNARLSHFA